MSHKALYRKYRPTLFKEVVGQNEVIKTLINSIKVNKISHAYIFAGPRGTGKTSVAKIFGKAVNCTQIENGEACNICENCLRINENIDQDIIEIDAASNNGVDEIRDLRNKVNFVPTSSKYKIYIIDEVHMLSVGAFNALLKTLEEPPTHVIFILATTEPYKIPLTIASRCQRFHFKKIIEIEMKHKLTEICEKENIKIEDEAIEQIVGLSDGGMRDAINLIEQLGLYAKSKIKVEDIYVITGVIPFEEVIELLKSVHANDFLLVFQQVDKLYEEGKDFSKLTQDIIIFMRDLLIYKKNHKVIKNSEKKAKFQEISNIYSENKIYKIINDMNDFTYNMKTSNHPKILFELLLLKISEGKPKEALINEEATDKQEESDKDTFKEQKEVVVRKESNNKLERLDKKKDPLINNTLALAEKKHLNEIKEKWNQLNTYLINKDYKKTSILLLDAKVVAASNDHIILTYKHETMVKKHEIMNEEIQNLIENLTQKKYIVACLLEDEWMSIRSYYINLKKNNKKIELMPENDDKLKKTKKTLNKADNISEEVKEVMDILGEEIIEMKG